ncbi:MarR family winged helix-turn-helix transcriptional regulator [Rhodopirellula halodulae]|uniref:MarR family winged helix-turn-helix transcriptional regulator n=1 Tax=Rhodopirellula halodulae TaxID=2894198 RepID=UPI001E293FAA|nr:MarR family winged helix-turn-helix transcriptional regulator [Rhodopirellula sp. JC737]MCC9655016.1 MarR family winged helix-turn-helix transcriptional regulator [Rhodopirellula sp. JC737]
MSSSGSIGASALGDGFASLSESLHGLMHAHRRQLREGVRRHGIEVPVTHLRVLKCIRNCPDSTARSITQKMEMDKAQLARVLNDLSQWEYVRKKENPADRRSQFLSLSPSGKRLLKKLDRCEQEAAAEMTGGLSERQIQSFMRIAQSMIASQRQDS